MHCTLVLTRPCPLSAIRRTRWCASPTGRCSRACAPGSTPAAHSSSSRCSSSTSTSSASRAWWRSTRAARTQPTPRWSAAWRGCARCWAARTRPFTRRPTPSWRLPRASPSTTCRHSSATSWAPSTARCSASGWRGWSSAGARSKHASRPAWLTHACASPTARARRRSAASGSRSACCAPSSPPACRRRTLQRACGSLRCRCGRPALERPPATSPSPPRHAPHAHAPPRATRPTRPRPPRPPRSRAHLAALTPPRPGSHTARAGQVWRAGSAHRKAWEAQPGQAREADGAEAARGQAGVHP